MTPEEAEAILSVMGKSLYKGTLTWYVIPNSTHRIGNDWKEVCPAPVPREQAVMLAVAMLTG